MSIFTLLFDFFCWNIVEKLYSLRGNSQTKASTANFWALIEPTQIINVNVVVNGTKKDPAGNINMNWGNEEKIKIHSRIYIYFAEISHQKRDAACAKQKASAGILTFGDFPQN